MGKTTNILDLNNRLTKVEKENVAQNNYNSLKNRPKINGNLLTGDKTGAQLGLADAQDLTRMISKLMFGGYSNYYRTTQTSIDGIVDNVIIAPPTDDSGYFSAENKANVTDFGNRQFVFGWINTSKKYAWIIVCSFSGISVGIRENASTFTFKSLTI